MVDRGICVVCGKGIVYAHPMTEPYGIHGSCMPEAIRIIQEYNNSKQTIKDHIIENNLPSGDFEENYGNNKSMWSTYEMCQELKRAKREENE